MPRSAHASKRCEHPACAPRLPGVQNGLAFGKGLAQSVGLRQAGFKRLAKAVDEKHNGTLLANAGPLEGPPNQRVKLGLSVVAVVNIALELEPRCRADRARHHLQFQRLGVAAAFQRRILINGVQPLDTVRNFNNGVPIVQPVAAGSGPCAQHRQNLRIGRRIDLALGLAMQGFSPIAVAERQRHTHGGVVLPAIDAAHGPQLYHHFARRGPGCGQGHDAVGRRETFGPNTPDRSPGRKYLHHPA